MGMPIVSTSIQITEAAKSPPSIYKMPAQRAEISVSRHLSLVSTMKLTMLPPDDVDHHLRWPLVFHQLKEADIALPQVVVPDKRSPASTHPQGTSLVTHLGMPCLALPLELKRQSPAPLSQVHGSILRGKNLFIYTQNIEYINIKMHKKKLQLCRGTADTSGR